MQQISIFFFSFSYYIGLSGSVITTYESIGYYPVYINVSNRVSWMVIESTAVIQIDITNFRLIKPLPMKFGEFNIVGVRYDSGTNLTSNGTFNGTEFDLTDPDQYFINEETGEGYIVIGTDKYDDRGFYPMELTTWNLVSGPFTDIVQVRVEFAITDFRMWVSDPYILPWTTISIGFDMLIGSDLSFTVDFDDDTVLEYYDLVMKRSGGDHYLEWHQFGVARDYNVTIHASSCVSNETLRYLIKVQNPVENVTMTVYSPGTIPYLEVGTIRYEYLYSGDPDTPPTDASVDYYFNPYITPVEQFTIDDANPVVQDMPLAIFGTYYTNVNISNLVSWMYFTAEIEMERPVLNLRVTCDRPHIRVNQKAHLLVEIDWGSRVYYTWDYKDGNVVDVRFGGNMFRRHEYKDEGIFYVSVTATNLLGSTTYVLPYPVIAQYPIKGFEWTGRRLSQLLVRNGYVAVPFYLHMSKEFHFPTDVTYTIDWGDGQVDSGIDLTTIGADAGRDTEAAYHIMTVSHDYVEWGHYNVTISMENLISDGSLLYDIWIYETITQLEKEVAYNELILDGDYSLGNATYDKEGYTDGHNYFRLEEAIVVIATHASGTGLTYTWDFGDTTFVPDPVVSDNSTMLPTTTTMPTTPMQEATSAPPNCSLLIDEWVNATLDQLAARDYVLYLEWFSLQPNCSEYTTTDQTTEEIRTTTDTFTTRDSTTNASSLFNTSATPATWSNDSLFTTDQTTYQTTQLPRTPCPTGPPLRNQMVLCSNYSDLYVNDTLDIVLNYTYFLNENDTVHMGYIVRMVRDDYCLDRYALTRIAQVLITRNYTIEPSVCQDPTPPPPTETPAPTTTTQPTDAPTAMPPWVVQTSEPRAIWWYSRRGTYTITLNVSNPVHWVQVQKTIKVQRTVEDLVLTDHGPRSRNTTIEFELNTGNVGTDVCYYVDFRDKSSDINSIALWGHRPTCTAKYPEDMNDPFLRFTEVSNVYLEGLLLGGRDPNITLSNVFQSVGAFRLSVTASNMVSEQVVTLLTSVTKGPCFYPDVIVQSKNQCDKYYPFCDSNGYREYFASRDVYVYSSVKINCTSVKYAMYTWRAWQVSEPSMDLTEIYDLGDTIMAGFTRREFAIKKAVLGYGLYKFELNTSMWGESAVESVDSTFIRVVPTPLVSTIGGGSERRLRWDDRVTIDGYTDTYDPDVDLSDRTGFRYMWFCRREHETFEEWNSDYTTMIAPGGVNASFVHEKSDYGGCFGRYGFDKNGFGSKL